MTSPAARPSSVLVVPIKPPARGKSRLDALPPEQRVQLAAAFARDTVAAAREASGVRAVLVVTDDHRFAAELSADGCEVMPDGVADDLNATLQQAAAEARRRWPDAVPVALCADLPCLRPADLTTVLAQLADAPLFVRDDAGAGTTLYAAAYGDFRPAFGRDSAARHLAAGAREVTEPVPTLRLDVDDPGDLGRALLLGVGEHTAGVWGRGGA